MEKGDRGGGATRGRGERVPEGLEKLTEKDSPSRREAGKASAGGEPRSHRVAKFLLLIGPEEASAVLRRLPEGEVEDVARAIASIRVVPKQEAAEILEEFGRLRESGKIRVDGRQAAYEMLERAFGAERAERLMPEAHRAGRFAFLNDLEPQQLRHLFRDEPPSVVALVLPHLERANAAAFLAELDPDVRTDVVLRTARGGKVDREVLARVEEALTAKIRSTGKVVTEAVDGKAALAEILRHSDPAFEENLLSAVENEDPALAEELKEKLFTVDMLMLIDDKELSVMLRDLEDRTIALALKGRDEELRAKVLRCVSERRRLDVIDEYKAIGPARKSDVAEASRAIVTLLKQRVIDGTLRLRRSGVDEWV